MEPRVGQGSTSIRCRRIEGYDSTKHGQISGDRQICRFIPSSPICSPDCLIAHRPGSSTQQKIHLTVKRCGSALGVATVLAPVRITEPQSSSTRTHWAKTGWSNGARAARWLLAPFRRPATLFRRFLVGDIQRKSTMPSGLLKLGETLKLLVKRSARPEATRIGISSISPPELIFRNDIGRGVTEGSDSDRS